MITHLATRGGPCAEALPGGTTPEGSRSGGRRAAGVHAGGRDAAAARLDQCPVRHARHPGRPAADHPARPPARRRDDAAGHRPAAQGRREILSHATTAFTMDVYTQVAEELADAAAEALPAYMPRAPRKPAGDSA